MCDLNVFTMAVRLLMDGKSPYLCHLFYSPPWALILLAPFAYLPQWIFCVTAVLTILYLAYKERLTLIGTFAFVLSSSVVLMLLAGNMDWMVLPGMYLPAVVGIPILLMKPQMTIGYVVHYFIRGKHRTLTALVLIILLLISWSVYQWPLQVSDVIGRSHNSSIFPWGLLVGIPLLLYAIIKKDSRIALLSSPFLSPYVGGNSWIGAMLIIASRLPGIAYLVTAGTWAYLAGVAS